MPREEIKIGCRAIKESTNEKPTEIKPDFTKPSNNKKSCCNFTFTQHVFAFCLWGKQGVKLSFDFLIVEHCEIYIQHNSYR